MFKEFSQLREVAAVVTGMVGGWLLEAQQFGEQDRFVTAWASTSQTQGMTKQPAVWATSLTERAFPARRALVQRVGD
jgi:hypothetical protein